MTPTVLELGTWNMHRGRPPLRVRGELRELLRDHPVDVLALQELRDYVAVADDLGGYRLWQAPGPRGVDQLGFLVREDHKVTRQVYREHGDGWTTVDGKDHVATGIQLITVDDWCRLGNVHMPPSIDWRDGRPVGPVERVDDLEAAMRFIARRGMAAMRADARIVNQRQRSRYGSDHPLTTLELHKRGGRALTFLGDWNCRPGRDEGRYSLSWVAQEGGYQLPPVLDAQGALHGIDRAITAQR